MERCPNCGAPARPGAKFCTTCGYRLPVTIPVTDQPDTSGQASSTAASSWPPPPQRDASDQSGTPTESTDDTNAESSFTIPVTSSDTTDSAEQADTVSATATETDTESVSETVTGETTSTDSVVSSTWTAASPSRPDIAWGTARAEGALSDDDASTADATGETDVSAEQASEPGDTAPFAAVTEETIVVDEPASQYEGWSAAVVEEVAPPSSDHGTNVARATALLDELRLLLPALNTGPASDAGERVASELEAALSGTREEGDDRASLRAALTDARDNPRDIQTILGLSQQADAAIALLDDYDRLVSAVRHAIHSLRPSRPGLYPSED